MAALQQTTKLTTAHFLLMGLTARAMGLHTASVDALESDNPFAAFTLIRAYAENAAAALYAVEHPNKIDGLLGLGDAQISIKKVTNYAMQGSKRFGEFRHIYSELSQYAHPMSRSMFASSGFAGGDEFRWSSQPAFKFDTDFLMASGWIVELAEANAHLLTELGATFRRT